MPVSIEDALFRPRGIAIVGASNDPAKLSGRPLDYLLKLRFGGAIVPVNPTRAQVQGVPSYRSLADVTVAVDLAIVVVPSPAVAQALRVIGPNCLGSFALPSKAFATFSSAFDEEGALPDDAIALVSQSGAVGTFIYATMVACGVGVRYFANTGNEADVSVGELLGSLAEADDVDVLIGYLEDARRLGALEDAARRADRRGKPLLLIKSGATAEGSRAVGLHTGFPPGSDADFQAMVERHGAIRVESMEAAADAAMLFRQGRSAAGPRVAIVTSSGGASALTTDAAVQIGLRIDPLSPQVQEVIRPLLPGYGSVANPVDLTGALLTDPSLIRRALEQMMIDPAVDIILVVLGNADRGREALVEGIAEVCGKTHKPFVVAWSGSTGKPRELLQARRIPTYSEPLRAVRAIQRLVDFSLRQRSA